MITKQQWDESVSNLGKKIFSLYCDDGAISLQGLNDLRAILKEMDDMMQKLLKALRFPFLYSTRHGVVKKEVLQLENQYKALEYNLQIYAQVA